MFVACGYNLCKDGNTLDYAPIQMNTLNDVVLKNGIFDHWNVNTDIISPHSTQIPSTWDILTVMDANFNGTLNAGNLEYSNIEAIKIKRRLKNIEFNWTTIDIVNIDNDVGRLNFVRRDFFAQNGAEYEYAFVPVVGGIEGNPITESIGSKFEGVFICDRDSIYRFYAGVSYGALEQVQKVGVFEPYGRKYPVIVSNGALNYKKGSVSGMITPNGYLDYSSALNAYVVGEEYGSKWLASTEGGVYFVPEINTIYKIIGPVNDPHVGKYYHWNGSRYTEHEPRRLEGLAERRAMVAERDKLLEFLTDKKPKIIKDWNGNFILMMIVDNPSVSFVNGSGMGLMNISTSYVEIGDPHNANDMYDAGLAVEGG